ncbi:MAG: CRISPR-associated endoribonuclease Cas6 [Cyanobacteria bacterium J06614_10]
MPQSLVLNFITQSAVPPKHLQGYSLQQLFFNLVDVVDPALGHVLRRDKKNRSYSLSALQLSPVPTLRSSHQPRNCPPNRSERKSNLHPLPLRNPSARLQYTHSQTVAPHTKCWWRISFLDDELFDHLIFLWNQLRDEVFQLGTGAVKVVQIAAELTGVDWASSCSYRDLYEEASAHEREIHLQFVTPTAFESAGRITPLPTAEAIFQPLRKHWNRYSDLVFSPTLISDLVPIDFDIETRPVQSTLRNSFQTLIGCTGQISFRIGGEGGPLITKQLNALADFTRYCGIGLNTQLGMGVIKRINTLDLATKKPLTKLTK